MPLLALLTACGAKYTPLTEEQKQAKADSVFTAQEADLRTKAAQDCEAGMAAAVDAKVAEMQASANSTIQ